MEGYGPVHIESQIRRALATEGLPLVNKMRDSMLLGIMPPEKANFPSNILFPRRLKPRSCLHYMYGLKPVPFTKARTLH